MCCLYLRLSHFLMLQLVNICIIRNQKEVNELCAKHTFILNGSNHILAAPGCPGIVFFHKVGSSPSAYSNISEITALFFCVAWRLFCTDWEVKAKSAQKQTEASAANTCGRDWLLQEPHMHKALTFVEKVNYEQRSHLVTYKTIFFRC